jgi:hypothetical protein
VQGEHPAHARAPLVTAIAVCGVGVAAELLLLHVQLEQRQSLDAPLQAEEQLVTAHQRDRVGAEVEHGEKRVFGQGGELDERDGERGE